MKIKAEQYKIKGMNQDLSNSAFNKDFSWENHNIRLTARGGDESYSNNDLLSVTNEKGNLNITTSIDINGKVLGTCVINDYLVLFTKSSIDNYDRIYLASKPVLNISATSLLFYGDLNFDINSKIQTLPYFENEFVQKVYWIDEINQPRVINIANPPSPNYGNDNQFNFSQELALNETVDITKQYSNGYFKSGVIQYSFTYFNKNGIESNIFYTTPINYISPEDRGGKVDEIINNSFKIEIDNIDLNFDYIRIYSCYRTSLDSTPEIRSVIDLKTNSSGIIFVDNGTSGSIVSTDILLYIGGEELYPKCMSQKSNTLFFGNISLRGNDSLPLSLQNNGDISKGDIPTHNSEFKWYRKGTTLEDNSNPSYPYKPKSLSFNNNIKHFKYDETYRLGIQGQYSNGKWSTPIWLGEDKKVDQRYVSVCPGTLVHIVYINGSYEPDAALVPWLSSKFKKVRPVMVPLSYFDRTIVAQGIVNNTLGIAKNRAPNNIASSNFAYPDYLFRTNGRKSDYASNSERSFNGRYAHFDLLKLNNEYHNFEYIENMGNWGFSLNTPDNDIHDIHQIQQYDGSGLLEWDLFFVDKNMVNFWSPDIYYNSDISLNYIKNSVRANLYGFSVSTGLNEKLKMNGGAWKLDYDTKSSIIANYNSISPEWDYWKSILTPIHSSVTSSSPTVLFPMWSPRAYYLHDDDGVVSFTEFNKTGFQYFGWTNTLVSGNLFYDINNPVILTEDSNIYYKTNYESNSLNDGNVLYSKNFEKTYTSGSFRNIESNVTNLVLGYALLSTNSALSMKYNTANHALFSFKKKNIDGHGERFACMPRIKKGDDADNHEVFDSISGWNGGNVGWVTELIPKADFIASDIDDLSIDQSSPIFDLYVDDTNKELTRYGGLTEDALLSNNWIPCGAPVKVQNGMVIDYTDGDTYIQRFDFLRVFPNDVLQIPQHTEIISFLCESFINVDGRCDVNRYNTDSTFATPENYGLLNNAYSQKNNYFNYTMLDADLFKSKNFNNTILWTKTKQSGSIVDNWTGLSMLSSLDLDGTNGEVSSLNLFNNDLYVFQVKAIAKIMYNERVQNVASDGIGIELSNGYKVPEYRYITNQYGSNYKWSIIDGKNGVYFIDYINKSLNLLGEGIKDLGLQFGMKSWFSNNTSNNKYILSYDRDNNDLYIHDNEYCLNFSEVLNSFVSFYDYTGVIQMKNIWDSYISINYLDNKSKVWLNNKGDYNMFYGTQKPFSIEYLFNPDPLYDKIFNTFEYRVDNTDIDWNNIHVKNWYQEGQSDYNGINMRRKFNVNRVNLPRANDSKSAAVRDRIRSTWVKLKMSHNTTTPNKNSKFEMQDSTVTYTV